MAKFHFVEDYERFVASLIKAHPIDKAMSLAVGGSYHEIGKIEAEIVEWARLKEGMSIFDLGCGSGRLAYALSKRMNKLEFTGTDVVQSLLDYAHSKTPASYRYLRHPACSVPMAKESVDFCTSFSVFTHLLHSESYIYLEDMFRVLKPGGSVVMSFLEFFKPSHWTPFENEVAARRKGTGSPLNTLIERSVIDVWAAHLGYDKPVFIDGDAAPWGTSALGQSIAILRKRN